MDKQIKLAVVIPCYRVKKHILHVLEQIGPEVHAIYIVDDCCPEQSGRYALHHSKDPRLTVIKNAQNMGVGGAVMSGYQRAILDEATIIIKLDGDEQMDPRLIPQLISPILLGHADYTKGNRFFNLEKLREMPNIRLFGNALLSLLSKLSSGYWDIFDPTNGYTAIHADVARHLPFEKISRRYFFESDMLFRLNTLRAVVVDVPMDANYGDEVSNLKVSKIIGEFLVKHSRNFFKRLFYNYYLRNMSIASIELPLGLMLISFGTIFGGAEWVHHAHLHTPTPTGTIMIAALSSLMGLQFIMAFLNYDISSVCKYPLHLRFVQTKPTPVSQPILLDEASPAHEQPNNVIIE
jgi:dolichol-phosphate mannosyltransferase